MFQGELNDTLRKLIVHWNVAERRIKKAEQVRGNEVVAPAIFELRYAGRKIVDAIHIVLTQDWKENPEITTKIRAHLEDATEDCVKSKHDAIDAMLDFITIWFDDVERQLGLGAVQKYFPDYIQVAGTISDIQDKIANSRANRIAHRDEIYDQIEVESYDRILALFNAMKLSHHRVAAQIHAERREARLQKRLAIGGVVFGAVFGLGGIGVSVATWLIPASSISLPASSGNSGTSEQTGNGKPSSTPISEPHVPHR